MYKIEVELHGHAQPYVLVRGGADSTHGDEGQDVIMDLDALTDREGLTDDLFRIRNEGGTGIHKHKAEHGVAIKRLAVVLDDGVSATPWESDASLGWSLGIGGRILAVRDAKFMEARRDPNNANAIEIIHADTDFEPWDDDAWGPLGARPESTTALQLPGGRMLAYRIIDTDNPLWVELDDWSLIDYALPFMPTIVGQYAHLHEMPTRMAEWINSFANVGTRQDINRGLVFSDLGKGASFVLNYTQGGARWATWNVDKERDISDVPDSFHRNPSFWPDHAWHDGHDNCHYELTKAALREFVRWHAAGDGWKAVWSWWMFCRFAQWSATSGLCWSKGTDNRGGNNRHGWQWGEKSYRASSIIFVGGMPGSFALTPQKLYTGNVIAAAVLPYPQYREALSVHRDGLLLMGEGDELFGSRDMFWIGWAKVQMDTVGDLVGDDQFMPDDEIQQSIDKVLSSRDPATGLWPNFNQNAHVTNVFEQCQCAIFLIQAHAKGYRDLQVEINDVCTIIRDRFVVEFGRWALTRYVFTPDFIPGYVWGGHTRVMGLDVTEFTRPYMAVVLGSHAFITGDPESRRLFDLMFGTLGELADWSPPVQITTGTDLHPKGRDQRDVVITDERIPPHIVNPKREVDWHGGMHYSAWWKVLSATFMWADTIGVIRRHLDLADAGGTNP